MTRALLALALLGVFAAPAAADSRMSLGGGALYFRSEDAGISNQLTVDRDARGRAHFLDESDPYGITYPTPPCTPGKLNSAGNVVEVFCDRASSYQGIDVQAGPGEDHVTDKVDDLPAVLEGGVGADTLSAAGAADSLHGGDGNDVLDGGAGNDVLNGDAGADTVRGGAGDDTIGAADGVADTIDCGDGTDTATVDAADQVANCEKVTKRDVATPAGQPTGPDTRAPAVRVGGSTLQRARSRKIVVAVTSSERSRVDVSGYLVVGGVNERLRPAGGEVPVGGAGVYVTLGLTRHQIAQVRADVRRHRHPHVVLTVSASDAAGNTSRPRHLRIDLR